MSMSDEEAFESAEEGENENAAAKATSAAAQKSAPEGESSKSQPSAGEDKGGGKAKGKQHQRKGKGAKAQAKSAAAPADKKHGKPGHHKKSTEEKPKAEPGSGAKGDKPDSQKPKAEPGSGAKGDKPDSGKPKAEPGSGAKGDKPDSGKKVEDHRDSEKMPVDSISSESASSSSEKSPAAAKSAESDSKCEDLVTDKDSGKERREDKKKEMQDDKKKETEDDKQKKAIQDHEDDRNKEPMQEDKKTAGEKVPEEQCQATAAAPEEESQGKTAAAPEEESQGKTAGEVRQSLSSSTGDSAVNNPGEQTMHRDSGDSGGQASSEGRKDPEPPASSAEGGGGAGGGWNWGWGTSLLNVATNSLETFSSQVGEGLTTIMDSVESSLGVPNPGELAKDNNAQEPLTQPEGVDTVTVQPHEKEGSQEPETKKGDGADGKDKEEDIEEEEKEEKEEEGEKASGQQGSGWLSGWGMASFSDMGKNLVSKSQTLMNTGFERAETLAAGGLDILETIGKKTYTTLTDHDPGLRRAREFLHLKADRPSLSSVLRDAQDQADQHSKHTQEVEEALKVNFTALFEDNQGLAHLEALEMLSNRSERKVQSLLSAMDEDTLAAIRPQLLDIKQVFQQAADQQGQETETTDEKEHDFSTLVTENLSDLHLGTVSDRLNKVQENVRHWIADFYSHEDHSEIADPKEVHQRAVQSLADVTSKAVEQFHKAGEIMLMQKDEETTCTHRAENLAKLCSVLVTEVDILANKFSHCLNKLGEEKDSMEDVGPMVTSVFLEASNASGYMQDAFQLLLPVLQHTAIQGLL